MTESTTVRTPRVFAVQHPEMSEALIMEDIAGRTYDRLIVWAQMAILRAFEMPDDSTLSDKSEWVVAQLRVGFDSAVSVDLFDEIRKTQQKETS